MYFSVEAVTEPTLVSLEQVATVVVRHRGISVAELAALFDRGYGAIAESGAPITDPAVALYRGDPAASFDLELGFPLAGPLPGDLPSSPRIEASTLPAGRAVLLSSFGPYDQLPQAWARLSASAEQFGVAPDCFCEIYVSDPDVCTDPSSLRTDLLLIESLARD